MPLINEFNDRLKSAMKRKEAQEVALLRMVKTGFQKKMAEKGDPTLTDEAALAVIAAYVKQQEKARVEFEKVGPRGADKIAQIRYEVDYLKQFLPQLMDADQTRQLVSAKITELGIADDKQIGRLMGAIMKDHKGKVDAQLVKTLATELLGS